jgi:two-component system, chemotaxis family, chemotaxis protein CheY
MELESLSDVRVLLVARKGSSTQILRTVFNIAGLTKVTGVDEPRRAIELLCIEHFHAVFFEGALEHDGMPFALAARRLPAMLNPMVAIFAVFPEARRRDVETARDLGVHDVICRPVSPKTVMTKLRAVLVAPRPFIAAPSFFGPDRRAPRTGGAPPQERRQRVARKTKVSVALI